MDKDMIKKVIEGWEQKHVIPEAIGGHVIWVQMKFDGPHAFLYYRDEETEPFATVELPDDIPMTGKPGIIATVKSGERVLEVSEDKFDHLGVICWALEAPNPERNGVVYG